MNLANGIIILTSTPTRSRGWIYLPSDLIGGKLAQAVLDVTAGILCR